jgi:uncharacterized protein (TIGR04552 family)
MLIVLTRRLIPFNYVIPGESINHLLPFREAIGAVDALRRYEPELPLETSLERQQERAARSPLNEFSGPDYRIINFVADLPLRLERLIPKAELAPELAHVVFVLTEFQVCDKATAIRNESGASSHEAYKARQHERVRMRLFRDKDDPLPPD